MKKAIYIIFLLSVFILIDNTVACIDSDDGLSYFSTGTCEIEDIKIADYCLDSEYLVEHSCIEGIDDICGVSVYECPAGCENGRCKAACTSDGTRVGCHQFDNTNKNTCEEQYSYTDEIFQSEPRDESWPQQCKWDWNFETHKLNCWSYGNSLNCEDERMQDIDMCLTQPGCMWTNTLAEHCWDYDNSEEECTLFDNCKWYVNEGCQPDYKLTEVCWTYNDESSCENNLCWWSDMGFCTEAFMECIRIDNKDMCENNTLCYWTPWNEFGYCDSICYNLETEDTCGNHALCTWNLGMCGSKWCGDYIKENSCIVNGCTWSLYDACVSPGAECMAYDEELCEIADNCWWHGESSMCENVDTICWSISGENWEQECAANDRCFITEWGCEPLPEIPGLDS